MKRVTDRFLLAALSAAWMGGVVLFPHALEPGRAENDGVTLNLLVDRGDGRLSNDWYTATPALRVTAAGGRLRLEQHDSGLQIISRPLAVFPNECYALIAHGRELAGTTAFAVTDEEIRRAVASISATASQSSVGWRLTFDSRDLRRISVAILGQDGNVTELDSISVGRLQMRPPCS